MSLLALVIWITTAGFGLYLLAIWLIEYDKDFHAVAATRLPPPVLATHVLLACGGLLVWIFYLVYDQDQLAWLAVAALVVAETLGMVMAVRWLGVYRASRSRAVLARAGRHGGVAVMERPGPAAPPERSFPLPVVIAHGTFAAITLTLIVLTALGVGGS